MATTVRPAARTSFVLIWTEDYSAKDCYWAGVFFCDLDIVLDTLITYINSFKFSNGVFVVSLFN